jgi:flagellar hook-basal body complex protein FliE
MNVSPIVPPIGAPITAPSLSSIKPIETPARDKLDLAGSFTNALEQAHAAEQTSTHAAEQFAKGDPGMGIHEVMIASEKANISLRYATTLKNKALEAYRELMNTQV